MFMRTADRVDEPREALNRGFIGGALGRNGSGIGAGAMSEGWSVRKRLATIVLLLACACQAPGVAAPGASGRAIVTGAWGGRHVGVELGPGGGRLEYDCASGEIDGPVRPDHLGRFTARGYHTPGHGGPAREGEILPRWRALYWGRLSGRTMTLRVRIAETGVELGPFTLRRDVEPITFRCL